MQCTAFCNILKEKGHLQAQVRYLWFRVCIAHSHLNSNKFQIKFARKAMGQGSTKHQMPRSAAYSLNGKWADKDSGKTSPSRDLFKRIDETYISARQIV